MAIIRILFILFFWCGTCFATPAITGLSGTIYDGQTLTVTGTGFGTHNLDIEWLGGSTGAIESGTAGQSFSSTGWSNPTTTAYIQSTLYSDTRARSHSKSLVSSWPTASQYDSYFGYDTGIAGVEKIYITYWVYWDHADSAGQWKQFYIRSNYSLAGIDGCINHNSWYNTSGTLTIAYTFPACVWISGDYGQCFPDSNIGLRDDFSSVRSDQWTRVEIYAEESSAAGVRDGSYFYTLHRQTSTPQSVISWDGSIITRATGVTNRWRWFVLANYWGNITAGTGTGEKAYFDDFYIQVGTQSRVEIGNNATYTSCTTREVQLPTSWADTSIQITLNKGGFDTLNERYLYVIDADGSVNAEGYPLETGGLPPEQPPEEPPPETPDPGEYTVKVSAGAPAVIDSTAPTVQIIY